MKCESESCLRLSIVVEAFSHNKTTGCFLAGFLNIHLIRVKMFAAWKNVKEEAENDNAVQTVHLRDEEGQQHQDEEDIVDMDEVRGFSKMKILSSFVGWEIGRFTIQLV